LWSHNNDDDMEKIHQRLLLGENSENDLKSGSEDSNDELSSVNIGKVNDANISESPMITSKKNTPRVKRLYTVNVASGSSELISGVDTDSKTKITLKNLNKFVEGYSNRKIMAHWDIIESKYKLSLHYQVVMERGKDGLSYPVKHKIIHLSALTLLLCSEEFKIRHKELSKLYAELGFTQEQTDHSRKVAAFKLILRAIDDPKKRARYTASLDALISKGEPSVSLTQLRTKVFPTDPIQYKKAVDTIEKERTMRVMQMVEDRKLKQEMQAKTEKRIAKAVADFDADIKSLQFSRGHVTRDRAEVLRSVLDFAKSVVYDEISMVAGGVDPEVVDLLGIDVFPGRDELLSDDKAETQKKKTMAFRLSTDSGTNQTDSLSEQSQAPELRLSGSPSMIELLKQCVASGKGLNGLAFGDVIEIVQALASTSIQAKYRGYRRGWRYRAAKKMWLTREHALVKNSYLEWHNVAVYFTAIKNYCMRKITAWRYLVKRNRERRETYRVCFWPFWVWR